MSWPAGAQFVHQHRVGLAEGNGADLTLVLPFRPFGMVCGQRGEIRFPFQQPLVQLKGQISVPQTNQGVGDLIKVALAVEKAHLHVVGEHLLLEAMQPFLLAGEIGQVF